MLKVVPRLMKPPPPLITLKNCISYVYYCDFRRRPGKRFIKLGTNLDMPVDDAVHNVGNFCGRFDKMDIKVYNICNNPSHQDGGSIGRMLVVFFSPTSRKGSGAFLG